MAEGVGNVGYGSAHHRSCLFHNRCIRCSGAPCQSSRPWSSMLDCDVPYFMRFLQEVWAAVGLADVRGTSNVLDVRFKANVIDERKAWTKFIKRGGAYSGWNNTWSDNDYCYEDVTQLSLNDIKERITYFKEKYGIDQMN